MIVGLGKVTNVLYYKAQNKISLCNVFFSRVLQACECFRESLAADAVRVRSVRDRFESRLLEVLGADRMHLNCASAPSLSPPPIVNGSSSSCPAEATAHFTAWCARLPNASNVSLLVVHPQSALRTTFLGPRSSRWALPTSTCPPAAPATLLPRSACAA